MFASKRGVIAVVTLVATLVLVMFIVPRLATAATNPPRKTFPPGVACPAMTVYASRGSGEAFDDGNLGAGSQIKPFFDLLKQQIGTASVGVIANGYSAVPVINPWMNMPDPYYLLHNYKPSVLQGVANAVADLRGFMKACRSGYHTLVAIGYSQGADVTRRALAQLNSKDVPSGISLQAILLGDPNFDPQEDDTYGNHPALSAHGTYRQQTGRGRQFVKASGLPIPPVIKPIFPASSWCHDGDPVCQRGNNGAAHGTYASYDGFAMASTIGTSVPWRVPIAFGYVLPKSSRSVAVTIVFPAHNWS